MKTAPSRHTAQWEPRPETTTEKEQHQQIARAGDLAVVRAYLQQHPREREALLDTLAEEAPSLLHAVSQAPATSLLTEALGDGQANCLEQAVAMARTGEALIYLRDLGTNANNAGHVLLRAGDGSVRDPAGGPNYRSTADWIEAHSASTSQPAYEALGSIDSSAAREILALPVSERAAYIEQSQDSQLRSLAGERVADAVPISEADALNALARDWDALRGGDDKFGRKEIDALTSSAPPAYATPGLIAAAQFFKSSPSAFAALDTAAEGGKADGVVSINDFGARLNAMPLSTEERTVLDQVVAQWGALRGGDQAVGRGDLERLAGDAPPDGATPEQIQLARDLLARPELLKYRLDIAAEGGKPDGKFSADDLGALVAQTVRSAGTLSSDLAPAALALGSEDDAIANQNELDRGLTRLGYGVDGGSDALAPVIDAFDHDGNEGLGKHELTDAFASGVLVIDGRTVRIEGLAKIDPATGQDVPLVANNARIEQPINTLTRAQAKALIRPADSAAPGDAGAPVAVGGDEIQSARAAYETVQGTSAAVIVAMGVSGREYAISPTTTPNLFKSLTTPSPETGHTMVRQSDGLTSHHAVPVGGYTLPGGERGMASSVPLGEQALTTLVERYRELGDDATDAQQKFIRMLEATQLTTQDTDLGDEFTHPLSVEDAGSIFDTAKVNAGLEAAFADPEIQADYAAEVRRITPDLAGTVQRMSDNLTSQDFALHVDWLRAAGQDDAVKALIGDALLGLNELDPDAASKAAAKLNTNVMAAEVLTTDIGDLTEEEVEQASGDLLDSLGNAQTLIGTASGLSELGRTELADLRTMLSGAIGNLPLSQQLARVLKHVSATGGDLMNFAAVRQVVDTLKMPLKVADDLKHLVASLGNAGLWGSTVGGIGTFAAVNRIAGGHVNLGGDPWDRLQSASDFIGILGATSSFTTLAGKGSEKLGWTNFADTLGLDTDLRDAATALGGNFNKTTDAAVAQVLALGADASDVDAVERALTQGGMTGNTKAAAAQIVGKVDDGVAVKQLTDAVIRSAIRNNADYTTSGPGTSEHRLASALVGVDLADEAAVSAALTDASGGKTAAVADPQEASAIAQDIKKQVPAGSTSRPLTSVDDVLTQYGKSLVPGAVEIDPTKNVASFTDAAVRDLATDNTIASILDDTNLAGTTRFGLNWKQKLGFGINALGAVADTTGGLLNVVLGFKSVADGVKSDSVKDIVSGSLSALSGGLGTFSAVSAALRIGSVASKVLGPLGLVVDLVNVIVQLAVDPDGSPSGDFADGFEKYEQDGILHSDWRRNAESWYLNAIEVEESTTGS